MNSTKHSTYEKTASEIRAEMARQHVTLADLATATGISRSTLRRRIAGTSVMTIDELEAIGRFLGVRPGDLIDSAHHDL